MSHEIKPTNHELLEGESDQCSCDQGKLLERFFQECLTRETQAQFTVPGDGSEPFIGIHDLVLLLGINEEDIKALLALDIIEGAEPIDHPDGWRLPISKALDLFRNHGALLSRLQLEATLSELEDAVAEYRQPPTPQAS